jgi:hypothetical protein
VKNILLSIISLLIIFSALNTQAATSKKFPCPGVPQNIKKAEARAKTFFDKGVEFQNKNKSYGALERFLCSLKMKSDDATMSKVEEVSFAVAPKKNAIKLLTKFKNRNKKNSSVSDVKALIKQLNNPNAAPATPAATAAAEADKTAKAEEYDNTDTADNNPEQLNTADQEIAVKHEDTAVLTSPHNKKLRASGIASLIVSGAILGLGVTSHILSFKAKDDALAATDYDKYQYYEHKMSSLAAGAYASYLVGTIGIIVGSVLISKSKKKKEHETDEFGDTKVSISFNANPQGFILSGTF